MALAKRSEGLRLWDPMRELQDMSTRMTQLFGRAFGGERGEEALAQPTAWAPNVNISETDEAYHIRAELPAVEKKDVHVSLQNGVLTIQGERKREKEEKGERYYRVESYHGSFLRRFTMPDDADPAKVDAKFDNGMLDVHVAKKPGKEPKAKEIPIK